MVAIGWAARASWLPVVGTTLAVEDQLMPVEFIVVSNAIARADTLEAAALYHAGISTRIVLPWWQADELDLEIVKLGVPWLPPTELAQAILERKGVPREAIEVLPDPVDGLNAEVASVGRFAHERHPRSLLFVTARSHSQRARWLLERVVPPDTKILVRGSRSDTFDPAAWWHSREAGREVAMEYLRWANTFGLHDLWGAPPPSVAEPAR